MTEYRWNLADLARDYDAAAEHIHPCYLAIQDQIIHLLPAPHDDPFWIVDAGGGSGRLAARILQRFPQSRVVIFDQSAAFLELAQARLASFSDRAICLVRRLQDDWTHDLPTAPRAVVSMSAIHHLDSIEKQAFYRRCATCLAPGGVLLNGDEIRAADDMEYLASLQNWADHMHHIMNAGLVAEPMTSALLAWEQRNVSQFGQPRASGDDCHETIEAQIQYYLSAGFRNADVPWQQALWAILRGIK